MTTSDFYTYRKEYLSKQMPARLFRREEISFIGEDFYQIGEAQVQVNPFVSSQLDKFIGLTQKQALIILYFWGAPSSLQMVTQFSSVQLLSCVQLFVTP